MKQQLWARQFSRCWTQTADKWRGGINLWGGRANWFRRAGLGGSSEKAIMELISDCTGP